MDYNLAALKLFCGQLKDAQPTSSSPSSLSLGSILFQRAWLQGVLVSDSEKGCFVLDDGSGTLELSLSNDFQPHDWKTGMYVMVVGAYIIPAGGPPFIKVHKMVDLSPFPDREAMWHLEVIEAFKLFYRPSLDD